MFKNVRIVMIILLTRLSLKAMYLFPISALASTTGCPSKRHRRDTFRSLTGAYFPDSLNRRFPCFFTINNVLIHSSTGRIQPEQRVLVSTNEQCLLAFAHPRHRLMGCVNLPMDDGASSATKH